MAVAATAAAAQIHATAVVNVQYDATAGGQVATLSAGTGSGAVTVGAGASNKKINLK